MASRMKVTVIGATGETGSSIVEALLADPKTFKVSALVRPASKGKKAVAEFERRGVTFHAVELGEVSPALVQALTGQDVVIECMTAWALAEQKCLIEAASQAGVGRYVPSFFATVCPPRGVMDLRDKKEDLVDLIKKLYLSYTIIDVGWWYQLSLPPLPSGKVSEMGAMREIIGDGQTRSAMTSNRDIGQFVARIIADPQTLNKMVFAYGEVWTQNEIWDTLEEVSGESVERKHVSGDELSTMIAQATEALQKDPTDMQASITFAVASYKYSIGIRGDNTPEKAKEMGYLDAKELYPDLRATAFRTYIEEVLHGTARALWNGIPGQLREQS